MSQGKYKFQQGQTLLEVMVAFAVVTMILVAIVSRGAESIRSAAFARSQVKATRYAQEGVEWVREQRDKMGWTNFEDEIAPGPVTYCVPKVSSLLSSLSPAFCGAGDEIDGTIFSREVEFDYNAADASGEAFIEVLVTVTWEDSIGTHDVKYNTNLSKWYEQ